MSKVNPKIDLVFKKLFGSEENKDILMSLINSILPSHQQIVTLKLKNPYNISDYAEGKLSILDIKAEDEQGIQYDIEMQIKGSVFYGRRTLYYWAKMFGSQLDYSTEVEWEEQEKRRKNGYSELKKCIVISLMDFDFFKDENYHRCYMLKDRESNEVHKDLDYLDLYFVELDKFNKELKFVQNTLERWISFLNYAGFYHSNNLPKELAEIKEIKKANSKLEVMYFTEAERLYYEAQQKFWLDENTRLNELKDQLDQTTGKLQETSEKLEETSEKLGETTEKLAETSEKLEETSEKLEKTQQELENLRKEAQKSKIEIAKNAILTGLPDEILLKITDLSIDQIHAIRNEMQK